LNPWGETGINAQGVYVFNESSGQLIDHSENNRDSTDTTGTTYDVDGQFDGARRFDGADDTINFAEGTFDNSWTEFTIATWWNSDTLANNEQIMDNLWDENQNGWRVDYTDSGFTWRVGYGTGNVYISGGSGNTNEWYHYVGTASSNSDVELFIDASSVASDTIGSISVDPTVNTVIGDTSKFGSTGGNNFDGEIDVLRIYSDAKTDNWIQADFDASPKGGQTFFTWSGPETTQITVSTQTGTASYTPNTSTLSGTTTLTTNTGTATYNGTQQKLAVSITTWGDLDNIRNNENVNYILKNNLTPETTGYNTYASSTANGGDGWNEIPTYSGTLDGNGKIINGLKVLNDSAFIDTLSSTGEIKQLGFTDATINTSGDGAIITRVNDEGLITECFVSGSVTSTGSAGGLTGSNAGTISNSYSSATVTGSDTADVAGFAGSNNFGTITNSYSTGQVNASNASGFTDRAGTETNTYWNTESSGQSTSDGASTGLTTSEMQGDSADQNMTGLDYTNTWTEVLTSDEDVSEDGYPILRNVERSAQLSAQSIQQTIFSTTGNATYTPVSNIISGTTLINSNIGQASYELNESRLFGTTKIVTETGQAMYTGQQSSLTPLLQTGDAGQATYQPISSSLDFFGFPNEISVYIDGIRITTFTDIEIEKRLNEVDTFTFNVIIEDSQTRAVVQEGADVKILEGIENLLFKGRLTEVNQKSNYMVECEGDGMETLLLNRKTGRTTYNTNGDDIVRNVVDSDVMSYGTIENAPQVNLRFDHDNWARAVAGVANAVGFDWYVNQEMSDEFETDYLNFVEDAGASTSQATLEIGGNAQMVERNKDEGFVANDITLLGRGDGINQLEARVFAATTKYTDITQTYFGLTGYGIGTFEYRSEFNVVESGTFGIEYNNDGTKIFNCDYNNNQLKEYALSTAYDPSTASINNTYNMSGFNTLGFVMFKDDGRKMYISDNGDNKVKEYTLSTAFNPSTRTLENTLDVSSQVSRAWGIEMSSIGDVLHVVDGGSPGQIVQYNLSTNYDLGSATYDVSASVTNNPSDIVWSPSGDKILVQNQVASTNGLKQFEPDTNFDLSNLTEKAAQDLDGEFNDSHYGITFNGDGLEIHLNTTVNSIVVAEAGENIIKVADATQLGSIGDTIKIRAGIEVIECTIEDNTSLKVINRGLEDYEGNDTEQIKHYENIRVWLVENVTQGIGPFEPTTKDTAEDGSSIEVHGVKQLRETDKTIVDISTLEKTADLELKNRFEDVFRIQVKASEPRITKNLELGDTVTVTDLTAMDVDDTFDIVGFDIRRSSSREGTVLHLANRPRRLTERLSEIESDRNTLNAHMQGATNIDSQNFNDNADADNPLTSKLRIPDDAVAVNKTELTFTRQSFRGYVQNKNHNHNVEIGTVTSNSSDTGEWLNAFITDVESGGTLLNPSVFASTPDSPTGSFSGAAVTGLIENYSGSTQTYDWELENTTTSTMLDSGSKTISSAGGFTYNYSASTNEVSAGDDIEFRITNTSLNTDSNNPTNSKLGVFINSSSSHNHNIDIGTETSTDSGAPDYGIFEPSSEPDIDVDLVVDGTKVQTFNNVSVGDEIDPVRIEQELEDPLAGAYHDIELVPVDTGGGESGRCKLDATVYNKVFIESTL